MIDETETLNELRAEMITALELFFSHVKYTLTILLSMIGAGLAVGSFALSPDARGTTVLFPVACAVLVLVLPVSIVATRLVQRYYRIYVSYYVYAARAHVARAAPHPWFNFLQNYVADLNDDKAVDDFITNVRHEEHHSWRYYDLLMRGIGVGSAGCGLAGMLLWWQGLLLPQG